MNRIINHDDIYLLQNQQIQPLNRESIKGLFTFYREQEQMQQHIKKEKLEQQNNKKTDKLRKNKSKRKITVQVTTQRRINSSRKLKLKKSQTSPKNVEQHKQKSKSKKRRKIRNSEQSRKQLIIKKQSIQYSSKTLPLKIQEPQDAADKFLKKIKQRKLAKQQNLKTQTQTNHEIYLTKLKQQDKDIEYFDKNNKFYKLLYPKENLKTQNSLKSQTQLNKKSNKLSFSLDLKKRVKSILQIQKNEQKRKILIDEIIQKHANSLKKKRSKARPRLHTQIPSTLVSQINHTIDMNHFVRNNFYHHPKSRKQSQEIEVDQVSEQDKLQQFYPISPPSIRQQTKQHQQTCKINEKINEHKNSLKFPKIKNRNIQKQIQKIKSIACSKQKILMQYNQYRCEKCEKQKQKMLTQPMKHERSAKNFITNSSEQKRGVKDPTALQDNFSLWHEKKNQLLRKLGIKI